MKQKTALAFALVSSPETLLLDEPTVGVDVLSRRELWAVIRRFCAENPAMQVYVSTTYTDKTGSCDKVIRLKNEETLPDPVHRNPPAAEAETVIEAKGLVKRFGSFTAVDHISFGVRRGEIFGLLGANGADKTTTFRMLCGLDPVTEGRVAIAGLDLRQASGAARNRIGFVAQKFSLYADLSVRENLKFFGGAYGLVGARLRDRIAWAEREFRLGAYMRRDAGDVPLGIKQHLAMAAALLHEPEILFLDEATSGAAIARAYQNAIGQALRLPVRGDAEFRTVRPPQVRARMWFNNANRSAWFLIPGVIVLVMAIIGCMLTSMQMAKEYEHGTIESLFATPVTAGEILVSKLVSNYLLGMVGLAISLVFSRYLFHVPMLGSLGWVVAGASLFILSQMGLGLVISSLTKSQFLSAQVSMIVSFLPVFLLSGFLYEIPNMPKPLQTLTALLPARYFVEFLQTAFLVGDVPTVYVRDLLPLVGFTVVFLVIAKLLNPKRAQGGNG